MILGMDILQRLGVRIDVRTGTAKPTVLVSTIKPEESWRVPAHTSVVFSVRNPHEGHTKKILFEPSEKLPQVIRGTTSLGRGRQLYVRLENVREEDQVLDPTWEIGNIEVVEEEPDFPTRKEEEEGLPEIHEELSEVQKRSLQKLLDEYKDVFVGKDFRLGSTGVVEHEIHTHGPLIRQPYCRHNPEVRRQEQEQLKEMFDQGVVRLSSSPWASLVVMVKKKDGTLHFCIDFRKLNDFTIKDAHPLPRIDDTLEALKGAKYFSTLDLKSGYWQVPIKEKHKLKTAFRTSSEQLYEFNRLPFGLCNASTTFSQLMDNVLSGLSWEVCLYYLDDIIVFSRGWQEHLNRLRMVFSRLREANLHLRPHKCTLAKSSVTFLGHLVSEDGLRPDHRLLDSIRKIPTPTTVTQVKSFLGLVGYYHRFIKGFSKIAAPLNRLLEKNRPFKWDDKCTQAYQELEALLLQELVVAYPDFTVPFRLYTDASNIGLGAILAQQQEGKERIICCASRTLNSAEQNYSTTKKECLTVVWGIRNFRNYLIANHFKVYTDHYSLQWLRAMKNESALLHCWAAQLDYDFEVLHRPGKNQGNVDALSRLPTDSIHLLGHGKVTLATEEEIREVLEKIHQDGI